jgi:spore coat polysaccharide biosynthesis predicted glycosyltransferase SpsG
VDKKYNILICPLGWGLGHAARMIPVASRLKDLGHRIFFGAEEKHFAFLRSELPDTRLIKFPGFDPGYSFFLPAYMIILLKIPLLVCHTVREHYKLKQIIRDHSIDILISDNRFGLWNKSIKTVYVTHMPLIPFPKTFRFLEFTGIKIHNAIIRRYSLCFIPDLPGSVNISGRLTHLCKLPDNIRFIGILSRFLRSGTDSTANNFTFRHNSIIISGPSPQSDILRNKLVKVLKNRQPLTVILCGKPEGSSEMVRSDNILYYDHLPSSAMKEVLIHSDNIIARAGYSTIMDLICLGKSALLIPTPGQTEQEYLAEYLSGKGWFSSISQRDITKDLILSRTTFPYRTEDIIEQSRLLLDKALNEMLND